MTPDSLGPRTSGRLAAFVLLGLVFLSPQAQAADNAPEVLVELSRQRVYEGESVRYRVTLNHVQHPEPPKLEGFDDFNVQPAGQTSLNSRQIININGQVTEIIRYGRAYDYLLTPRRAGLLEVPAPVAEVDGRLIRGRPLTLQVIAPQDQDLAILEIAADRASVYPMQPFTVTLTVAVKALPAPFADRNPVAVLRRLPTLSIPWADDQKLPAGIQPERSWQRWLGALQNRGDYGFSVNNIGDSSIFSLFDEGPLAFLPDPHPTARQDRSGNQANYWQFDFARRFTAREVGQYRFGPVTLKGQFVTRVNRFGEAETEDVYAIARPIVVTVKDVPEQGRPESYIGAIGQFEVDSKLVPTKAKVGDPLTLTLTLRGRGTLDRATAPKLNDAPEIAQQFRVYDATEETRGGERYFTYSLRPLKAGDLVLPPIPVSYFDVEKEQFVTLRTKSIPLTVAEAEQLSDRDIAMAGLPGAGRKAIEVRQDGILANITDLAALQDQRVSAPRWFIIFACMAGMYVVVVLVSGQVQQLIGDKALLRRRAAPRRARTRLRNALAEIASGRLRDAADQLGAALVGLVADVAGTEEAGLTSGDVRERLVQLGVDQPLVQRLSQLLEACDGARYGASEGALQGLGQEAESLLGELLKAFKKKKLL